MYGTLPAAAGWQTPRSTSWHRHLLAQLKQLSTCIWVTHQGDLGHGLCMGDDFNIAGDGEDLDWLSQKLNEKIELVQKARLGPGDDNENNGVETAV